jgi:serine/threonine protein kinase
MENTSGFFESPAKGAPAGTSAKEIVSSSESGYSEIWRVDRGGRFRVLKCLKPQFRGDPLYERLLLKEIDIGYSLNHENICEYYSFGSDPDLGNCIEMEWVDGRTLEEFLSEGKRDRSLYDKVVGEICSALSYMHAKQVLHRDLKPSNILVTYNGDNVKLIDFGLSDADSSSVLKTPAGTAVFAAPEVRSGGKASVRSDLYSLGVVMSLFPVRKYSPIVRKLLSVRPEGRFGSVTEVQKALKSDMPAVAGIVFVLFIAVMALVPLFERWSRPFVPADSVVPTAPASSSAPAAPSVILNEVKNLPDTSGGSTPLTSSDSLTKRSLSGAEGPAAPTKKQHPKTTPKKSTDAHLIDELFRQATELFE